MIYNTTTTCWRCLCSGSAICGGTLMKRSLSSSPTGLLVSLRTFSSCSIMLWVEFFSHRFRISSFTSSTHCTPCQQQQHDFRISMNNNRRELVMRANAVTFLSVRLSMVVKPNTSSGSPSSSLSSGTSACWSTVNNGGQPEYRLKHLSWFENHWGTHPDYTANVILLNDDVCHLWCINMSLQEELFPNMNET